MAGRVGVCFGFRVLVAAWFPLAGFPIGDRPERAWGRILQVFVRAVKMFAGLKCFITFASPKESSFKFAPARLRVDLRNLGDQVTRPLAVKDRLNQ